MESFIFTVRRLTCGKQTLELFAGVKDQDGMHKTQPAFFSKILPTYCNIIWKENCHNPILFWIAKLCAVLLNHVDFADLENVANKLQSLVMQNHARIAKVNHCA